MTPIFGLYENRPQMQLFPYLAIKAQKQASDYPNLRTNSRKSSGLDCFIKKHILKHVIDVLVMHQLVGTIRYFKFWQARHVDYKVTNWLCDPEILCPAEMAITSNRQMKLVVHIEKSFVFSSEYL